MKSNTLWPQILVALGDSITYGYPFSPADSWVEALRQKTRWQVINAGLSGDTLADMFSRLKQDVLAYHPDIVTLMGGTNDIYQGMSQPQLRQNFLAIVNTLRQENIVVIVGLPLPVDDCGEGVLKTWRTWLQEYCRTEKLATLDFYRDFVDKDGLIREDLLLDGCHPRVVGYETMAKRAVSTFYELGLIADC